MLQLDLPIRTWGGRRPGSGRKPSAGRRSVPHRRRPLHAARCPVHVTLRAKAGLPSLRDAALSHSVRDALGAASSAAFRLLHFSIQTDHVHLLVEADGSASLQPGIQGLAIRVAKTINRTMGRRGRVWGDRYHARMLTTEREVRNALVYVLRNWCQHVPGARGLDPHSSSAWFDGWRTQVTAIVGVPPVAAARTWLARVGWRRHGLIGPEEIPQRNAVRRALGLRSR